MFRINRLLFFGIFFSLIIPFTVAEGKVPSEHLSDTKAARLDSTAALHNHYQAAQNAQNANNNRQNNYAQQIVLLRHHYYMTKKSKALKIHGKILNKSKEKTK